jgi:hypothetical protein
LEPFDLRRDVKRTPLNNQAEYIFAAAQHSAGYHALIVHVDADDKTPDKAMNERIEPGFELVKASQAEICKQLIPIIPIRMTEAWMLADPEAFKEVIGTNIAAKDLGLPVHPHQVESVLKPKQKLKLAIRLALAKRSRRRRSSIRVGELYEPLARQISLERLSAVPAYQRFVDDFTTCLIALRLIE